LLVLLAVTGCKVSVAAVDFQGLLDVPADVPLAVDPGVDGVVPDLPGVDGPAVDTPADDVPSVDLPVDDVIPADVPPVEPCGGAINPNCRASACDDGDPTTTNDVCAPDITGLATCVCAGTPGPCSTVLNPQCLSRLCDLGGGSYGLCTQPNGSESCGCARVDVCGLVKPATACTPLQCWLKGGVLGMCQGAGLDLTCGCKTAKDPCGSALNPQCWGNLCDLGLDRPGRCRSDGPTCTCVDSRDDPCGDDLNPQCAADKCPLLNGVRGQCQLGSLGLCGCGPAL
jgi:hypothetical protein